MHIILADDLQMGRVCAKFVPRLLSDKQKENRVSVCLELKGRLKADSNFTDKIITGDKSRLYGCKVYQ